jgi:hypothetical protein
MSMAFFVGWQRVVHQSLHVVLKAWLLPDRKKHTKNLAESLKLFFFQKFWLWVSCNWMFDWNLFGQCFNYSFAGLLGLHITVVDQALASHNHGCSSIKTFLFTRVFSEPRSRIDTVWFTSSFFILTIYIYIYIYR